MLLLLRCCFSSPSLELAKQEIFCRFSGSNSPIGRSSANLRSTQSRPPHAVDKESQFKIDKERARKALEMLDQQLQTLSRTDNTPVKPRPSPPRPPLDIRLEREMINGMGSNEMPELSGSYLTYSAIALLLLTFFNNIVFNAFIKPAVDGKDPPPTTITRQPLINGAVEQRAPPLKDIP